MRTSKFAISAISSLSGSDREQVLQDIPVESSQAFQTAARSEPALSTRSQNLKTVFGIAFAIACDAHGRPWRECIPQCLAALQQEGWQ